jgi:hypothetical protein
MSSINKAHDTLLWFHPLRDIVTFVSNAANLEVMYKSTLPPSNNMFIARACKSFNVGHRSLLFFSWQFLTSMHGVRRTWLLSLIEKAHDALP